MRTFVSGLLKEPLLHFLSLGALLFLAYATWLPPEDPDSKQLTVNRENLLAFIQYRAKAFDEEKAAQQLNAMPAITREHLIEQYIQEETLYREAKALQLDKNDYVARQRLIQQMRYLTQRYLDANMTITEEELQRYQTDNAERYKEPAKATFTHVFVNTEKRKPEDAEAIAKDLLRNLNQQKVPFHQSMAHGERFLYHRNYVNKDEETIASHFGEGLKEAVFTAKISDTQWQGPIQSNYGFHLVLLTQRSEAFYPELSEVKSRVAQDLHQERQQEQLKQAITRMSEGYEVTVDESLKADWNKGPSPELLSNEKAKGA